MHDTITAAEAPVLDIAYLDDMRGWVGEEVLAGLLDAAPGSLAEMIAAIQEAWAAADLGEVREAGHRLKGGASSIACRRLADIGHRIQFLAGLDDRAVLAELEAEGGEATAAIASYRAALP
ncbi:MAG: Hpt domain-containing protein [Pseudomonadota bacterium]